MASTTWPSSTGPPAATARPSRSSSAPWPSTRRLSARITRTSPIGLSNLALLYHATGRYAEAEPLYGAPSPSARRLSAPSTPTSPPGSTTWPRSTGPPAATARPSRSIQRALTILEKRACRRIIRNGRYSAITTLFSSTSSAMATRPPRSGPRPRRSARDASRHKHPLGRVASLPARLRMSASGQQQEHSHSCRDPTRRRGRLRHRRAALP